MPYLIETFDKLHASALRQALRDNHLDFLEDHKELLLACGAKLDDDGIVASGSVYILDVDTREQAEQFIAEDPYSKGHLSERTVITRWRKAYLDGKSHL